MIVNLRYHIFTITAIFAAFGIGILIGTILIGQEGLLDEQNKLIENIGDDIEKIRQENIALQDDIKNLNYELQRKKKTEEQLISVFLNKKMSDKEFLIYTENNKNNIDNIVDLFEMAGAKIRQVTGKDLIKNKLSDSIDRLIILQDIDDEVFKSKYDEDLIIHYNEKDLTGLILAVIESEGR